MGTYGKGGGWGWRDSRRWITCLEAWRGAKLSQVKSRDQLSSSRAAAQKVEGASGIARGLALLKV